MNLISTISNSIYSYPKKQEIKNRFMRKIQRKAKDQSFNKKIRSNLTKYMFDFFSYKELYELGKTNLYFMNNVIDYIQETEPWPEKVRKLKSTYHFTIYQNEVDSTLEESKKNKRRYKYPSENEKEVNYYQFDIDGNKYLSIARTFDWAHKNNDMYWREEKIEGSYEENSKVPYLNAVCWIDIEFSFFYVKPNNYKLYINEHFIKKRRFQEQVKLKVIIDENIVIFDKVFPSKEIFDGNNSNREYSRLSEDYICLIKIEDFNDAKKDENGDCKIKIQFNHNDNYWKGGWFLDGGCLREITQKELNEELEKIDKNLEEEERRKILGNNEQKK